MPIEHGQHGSTILTGDSIEFYRLAALKGAVGLEMKGLRVRRGPVIWRAVAREFGIKGGKAKVYDWLCARVEEMRRVQEHRTTVEGGRVVVEVEGKEVH